MASKLAFDARKDGNSVVVRFLLCFSVFPARFYSNAPLSTYQGSQRVRSFAKLKMTEENEKENSLLFGESFLFSSTSTNSKCEMRD